MESAWAKREGSGYVFCWLDGIWRGRERGLRMRLWLAVELGRERVTDAYPGWLDGIELGRGCSALSASVVLGRLG